MRKNKLIDSVNLQSHNQLNFIIFALNTCVCVTHIKNLSIIYNYNHKLLSLLALTLKTIYF